MVYRLCKLARVPTACEASANWLRRFTQDSLRRVVQSLNQAAAAKEYPT